MEYKYGSIQKYLEDESLLQDPSEEQFDKFVSDVADSFLRRNIELSSGTLKKRKESLERLWKYRGNTYNLFEVYIDSYFEIAAMYRKYALTNETAEDLRFVALTQLHAKSVLVLREMQALLEAGYPDGAMARWRTLHELAVFACIVESSCESAKQFILSEHINNAKGAKCYSEHASELGHEPYTKEELEEIDAMEAWAVEELGDVNTKSEHFWVRPFLRENNHSLKKNTFTILEKHTGMSRFRPYYKLACEKVHAPSKLDYANLAASGAESAGFIVGHSHYGHETPIDLAMISSMITFSKFVGINSVIIDHCVFMKLMLMTQDSVLKSALSDPQAADVC